MDGIGEFFRGEIEADSSHREETERGQLYNNISLD